MQKGPFCGRRAFKQNDLEGLWYCKSKVVHEYDCGLLELKINLLLLFHYSNIIVCDLKRWTDTNEPRWFQRIITQILCLQANLFGVFLVLIQWGVNPGADPEFTGGMIYNFWPTNTSESPPGGAEWRRWGNRCARFPPGPVTPTTRPWLCRRKWINGWHTFNSFQQLDVTLHQKWWCEERKGKNIRNPNSTFAII